MKKKNFTILGIIIIILIIIVVIFRFRYIKMVSFIDSIEIVDIDLNELKNGIYYGEFGDFLIDVSLQVTVKDSVISEIKILEQSSPPGYEAKEILDRIIKSQNTEVDVVTGATFSSKCIMIAVQNALRGINKQN